MAILPINIYGDSVLREIAKQVEKIGSEELNLIDNMIESMIDAEGIGLAANQIGIPKSIALVNFTFFDERQPPQALLNLKLLESEGISVLEEGCLSIPGVNEEVERPEFIKIAYMDVLGNEKILEVDGLLARVIIHELDHLNGVLFVDRLSSLKRKLLGTKLKKIKKGEKITIKRGF